MKVGLEVHQQLATGKLFCSCPGDLSEVVLGTFRRRLQATKGETGTLDPAAEWQASRAREYHYEIPSNACLVELDEEPPHEINPDALRVGWTVAELLDCRIVDEIQVMRKIVVDGSNTSGFQRTALLAMDGALKVDGEKISIASLCLEEDAARKIREDAASVVYRLDRLGIPLLEISTGPDIHSGEQARRVAETLGMLLRATGKVRRGIGTIREDLNISVEGGARVEIKGVQDLRLLARYVELEGERQAYFLALRDQLTARGARVPSDPPVDVTESFRNTESRLLKEVLGGGGRVWALPLPGFAGMLGKASSHPERLGRELADYARAGGVGGLFHSDELPGYGIGGKEVENLRGHLGLKGADAFILLAHTSADRAVRVLERVRERAQRALEGIPEETRDPLPDGRTRYNRPLPGRSRMYPETDVPTRPVSSSELEEVRRTLPERPEIVEARLERQYGLSRESVRQIVRRGDVPLLESLVRDGIPANLAARVLVQELPALEDEAPQEGKEWTPLWPEVLRRTLAAVEQGRFAKEGVGGVLRLQLWEGLTLDRAIERAGLAPLDDSDLRSVIDRVVERNVELVRSRGLGAMGPLMGDVMAEVRGRRDGKEVARVLQEVLKRRMETDRGRPGPRAGGGPV